MIFIPKMIPRISAVLICSAAPLFAAVVFDLSDVELTDGIDGGNTFITRYTGTVATPDGLEYTGGGTPSLTYNLSPANSYNYFSSYFNLQTLSTVGEGVEINYSFTPSSASAFRDLENSLRVGFYNSNDSRVTSDASSDGQVGFYNDTGYMALYSPISPANSTDKFYQRTGTNNILWSSGTRTAVSDSPVLDSPGTGSVTGLFRVELISSTSIQLTSQINGGTLQVVEHSVLDSANLDTSFDMISFFAMSGGNDQSLTFDEMTVTTIPEPSTLLLVMGAFGFFLLTGVRARRSKRRM